MATTTLGYQGYSMNGSQCMYMQEMARLFSFLTKIVLEQTHLCQTAEKNRGCCTAAIRHTAAPHLGSSPRDFTKIAAANAARLQSKNLVTVGVWLERTLNFDANVVCLLL